MKRSWRVESFGYSESMNMPSLTIETATKEDPWPDVNPQFEAYGKDAEGARTKFAVLDDDWNLVTAIRHYWTAVDYVEELRTKEAYVLNIKYDFGSGEDAQMPVEAGRYVTHVVELDDAEVERLAAVQTALADGVRQELD